MAKYHRFIRWLIYSVVTALCGYNLCIYVSIVTLFHHFVSLHS